MQQGGKNGSGGRLVRSGMAPENNRDDAASEIAVNSGDVGGVGGMGGGDSGEAIDASAGSGATPPRKRGRWKKVLLALVLLAGGVVALGPTIAGWVAPGIVASSVKIPGSVTIEKMSLGWLSGQTIGPVVIRGRMRRRESRRSCR